MKKHLIAAAVAGVFAVPAVAQNVSIGGLLDLSYSSTSGSSTTATTNLETVGASIGRATSAININVTEDLGGGLRAQAFYAIDPRANILNTASAISRHEVYVGLTGAFGRLRVGSVNSPNLEASGAGQIFGTATGGSFTESQTDAGGLIRVTNGNSVRFDTPSLDAAGGKLMGSVLYAPGNPDALTGGALPKITDIGFSFSGGPLNVNYSRLTRSATDAQAAVDGTTQALGTAAVAAVGDSTYQLIGANYAFGPVKVFAGWGERTGALISKTTRAGVSYTTGPVTVLFGSTNTKLTATPTLANDRETTGVRVEYALSKRSIGYAVYESYKTGAATANERAITAVGISHTF